MRLNYLALPLMLFFLAGCADQATAPDLDITASYAKKPKPPPDPDPPPVESANPVIAYESGGPGARALWVMDEDGSNRTEIFEPGNYFVPSWSSVGDGTGTPFKILITGTASGLVPVQVVEVVLDQGVPTAGAVSTLTEDPSYVQGRVSPSGGQFVAVWVGTPPEFADGGLVVSGLDAFSPGPVFENAPGHERYWPVWRSNTEIAFFDRDNGTGLVTLETLAIGSGTPTEVYPVPAELGIPRRLSWLPGASEVFFDAGGELYQVTLGGGEPVLENLGSGIAPSLSPDGTQFIYSNRDRLYKKTIESTTKDARLTGGRMPDWRR